jgi:hypothetical protein
MLHDEIIIIEMQDYYDGKIYIDYKSNKFKIVYSSNSTYGSMTINAGVDTQNILKGSLYYLNEDSWVEVWTTNVSTYDEDTRKKIPHRIVKKIIENNLLAVIKTVFEKDLNKINQTKKDLDNIKTLNSFKE